MSRWSLWSDSSSSRNSANHELYFVSGLEEVEGDAEIVSTFIYSRIDGLFLDRHPAVRLIATRSTTHDHLELESCGKRNVTMCIVPSYGDHVVAEHTFALLLAVARRLRESMTLNDDSRFSYEALRGFELRSKTFGIIGAGRIGLRTVPIARSFGMKVIACDIRPRPKLAAEARLSICCVRGIARGFGHHFAAREPELFQLSHSQSRGLCEMPARRGDHQHRPRQTDRHKRAD